MNGDGPAAPPEGFLYSEARGAFVLYNGPLFHRLTADDPTLLEHALFIQPRHTNGLGLLHGGMLSTFLDGLLGGAVSLATGRRALTMHLSVDFVRMARQGEWLLGEGRTTHISGDTAFAEGRAFVGGRLVGRANGVFKVLAPRRSGRRPPPVGDRAG